MPYQKTKEGRLVNEVTLGDGYPLSNDLQPLKIGGEASVVEISHPLPDGSDNGLFKVNGDLDITGTLKTKLSHDLIYDFDDEVNTLAQAKVDALVDSAPAALDTLNELAAALNDDASFSTTVTNSLATKVGLTNDETITGRKTFNKAFPQVIYTDDSSTDFVSTGLSGNTFFHKGSDDDIDFGFRNASNNDILMINSGLKAVSINDTSAGGFNFKIGDNGRMNMPVRGFEFENAHGYFAPTGDMFLPLFINATQVDLIRFQTPLTWEYYDYSASAWVDDMSNVQNLKNMLDGRRTSNYGVPNTKRKFRFVIERVGNWPDDQMFYIENTWSAIISGRSWNTGASGDNPLTPTAQIERLDGSFDASDDSNNDWTTNSGITTDWHTTGIVTGFGLMMYYSTGLHNTEKHIRVTVTIPEYADTSQVFNIKNIGLLSSYSSAARNQDAFVQDFNRNATGYGDVNIPTGHAYKINASSVLSATTLGSGVTASSLTSVGTLSNLRVSGNVGIGTTSPSQGLHVVDAGAIVAEFESSDNTTSMVHIENSAGEDGYIGVTNDGLVFSGQNYNSNNMIVDTSGNVGIGTTSPTEPLEVYSANSEAYHYPIVARNPYNHVSNLDYGVGIKLQLDDGNENKWASIAYEADSSYGNSGDLKFYVDGATNATPRMTLQHEGNLGIGTTSPQADLHINSANSTALYITASDSNPANAAAIRFAEQADGANNYFEIDYDGNQNTLAFHSNNQNDMLTLYRNGNTIFTGTNTKMGMGTSSPTTTLDVEGTVSYKHTAFTTSGPTDNVDVSGTTVLECDTSGGHITIGGFTGGVQGQILYIVKTTSDFYRVVLEHNEGGGSQDIFSTTNANVTMATRGGVTLYCNGTSWFILNK